MDDVNALLDTIDAGNGQLHVHPTFRWPDFEPRTLMLMGHLHAEEHPEALEGCQVCGSCRHGKPDGRGFVRCLGPSERAVYVPLGVLLSNETFKVTDSCRAWIGKVDTGTARNARKRERRARRK